MKEIFENILLLQNILIREILILLKKIYKKNLYFYSHSIVAGGLLEMS